MSNTIGFIVTMHSSIEVTRPADYDDRWDRDDTFTTWKFESCTQNSRYPDVLGHFNEHPNDGQTLYLVSVIYNTGGSFGRDEAGSIEHIMVYEALTDAEEAVKLLEQSTTHHVAIPNGIGSNTIISYCPWVGYFESIHSVEIYPFTFKSIN
jgi:hypothetical protein